METVPVEHVIATLVTLAEAVPLPLATVQVCVGVEGEVKTETLYGLPLATAVLNVKGPLAVIGRLSPALFWRTRPVPVSPVTVPPTIKVPEPEPEPDPEPELAPTGPLQAERTKEVRSSDRETTDLKVKFIEINYSFGTLCLRGCE